MVKVLLAHIRQFLPEGRNKEKPQTNGNFFDAHTDCLLHRPLSSNSTMVYFHRNVPFLEYRLLGNLSHFLEKTDERRLVNQKRTQENRTVFAFLFSSVILDQVSIAHLKQIKFSRLRQ